MKSAKFPFAFATLALAAVYAPAIRAQDPAATAAPNAAAAPASQSAQSEPEALPDWHVRFHEMLHQMVGVQALIETGPGTVSDHLRNFPKEWGRTWPGLGKRFASQYGQFLISETTELFVSAAHHEDPRYFRKGEGTVMQRTGYAIKSTFVARRSDGPGHTIALGRIAGTYGSWLAATRWDPDSVQSAGKFFLWGSVGMGTKSGVNLLREFWPDVKQRLKKHK